MCAFASSLIVKATRWFFIQASVFVLLLFCVADAAISDDRQIGKDADFLLYLYALKGSDRMEYDRWRGEVRYYSIFETDVGYSKYVQEFFNKISENINISIESSDEERNFFIYGGKNIYSEMPRSLYEIFKTLTNGNPYKYIQKFKEVDAPCFLFIRRVYQGKEVSSSRDFAFMGINILRGEREVKKCIGSSIFTALGFRKFEYSNITKLGFNSILSMNNMDSDIHPQDWVALHKIYR